MILLIVAARTPHPDASLVGSTPLVRFDSPTFDGWSVGQAVSGYPGDREIRALGALPGERWRVLVEHKSPHRRRAWGRLMELVDHRSPDRVEPVCGAHPRCGGCVLQNWAAAPRSEWKTGAVRRLLGAKGLETEAELLRPIRPAASDAGWRNKAQLVLGPERDGALSLGSFAPASHHLVDMAGCAAQEEGIMAVARTAARLAAEAGLEHWRPAAPGDGAPEGAAGSGRSAVTAGIGDLRYLSLRRSADGRIRVIVVTPTEQRDAELAALAERLAAAHPEVSGVLRNRNDSLGGVVLGPDDRLLRGSEFLGERLGPLRLRLSPRSFFQVNRAVTETILEDLAELVGEAEGLRVADLYCGVGGLGLRLAVAGARVVGVERHPPARADAEQGAAWTGVAERCSFITAEAVDGLPGAAELLGGLELVLVNPPRRGLTEATTAALVKAAPVRIVYLSCNPSTLARDLLRLRDRGYRTRAMRLYDMMPGTPGVESLCLLSRETFS